MSLSSRSVATLAGAAAACVAVREGARAFVAPHVVTPEELHVSAPALRGAAAEQTTSVGSLPYMALTVASVGAAAVKLTSRRRTGQSRAQVVVRHAQDPTMVAAQQALRTSSESEAKAVAKLLTSAAAKVLEAADALAATQAAFARLEGRPVQQTKEEKEQAPSQPVKPIDFNFITATEVKKALDQWGQSILDIGAIHSGYGDYVSKGRDMVKSLYDFEKPQQQFRRSPEAALTFFVGGNKIYPKEKGFALRPWTKFHVEPIISMKMDTATATGHYVFTDYAGADGAETKYDFTFEFKRDSAGKLKIVRSSEVRELAAYASSSSSAAAPTPAADLKLTEPEVAKFVSDWGNSIIDIGNVRAGYGDCVGKATELVKRLYANDQGFVSYLAGGAQGKGFATGWTRFRMEPNISLDQQAGTASGHFYFTDFGGKETKFQFTFRYTRDMGKLKAAQQEISVAGASSSSAAVPAAQPATPVADIKLTESEVNSFLSEWGSNIIDIGNIRAGYGDYFAKATEMVKRLYANDQGIVSYLAGGSQGKGFATGWTKFRFEPSVSLNQQTGTAAGHFLFTDFGGKENKFRFGFGFTRDMGRLKVVRQEITSS